MAKAVFMYRTDEPFNKVIDEPVEFDKLLGTEYGAAPRARSAPGVDNPASEIRARLRLAYMDEKRKYPRADDAAHLGRAWRRLREADRQALLAVDDDGIDPSFEESTIVKTVVGKLADFALEVRAELIGKATPSFTPSHAMAAAIDERPDLFKLSREAKRAALIDGSTEPIDAEVAKRRYALQQLTKRAEQIVADNPGMSIQAGRIEARRLNPELAARERA